MRPHFTERHNIMDKKTLVIVALATVIAHDTVVAAKNRRRFQHNLKVGQAAIDSAHYLASILDKHGIELDDFDKTALLTLNNK